MSAPTPDAVVIGHGQVGPQVTALLQAQGRTVRVLTRSGSGPTTAERVAVDLLDAAATARAIGDAPAVFLCVHAPYSAKVWADVLPRMEASVTRHAAASGAVVLTAESLYAWDGGPSPITTTTPISPRSRKGAVRRDLLLARTASGARITSVVAGDFYGPGVLQAHAGDRLLRPLLTGGVVRPVGNPDVPHAFTHVPDLVAAMVRAAELREAGGASGHEIVMAPNPGSVTMRELVTITARAAGVPVPRVAPMPVALLRAVGLVMPSIREVADVAGQLTRPFEVDARASEALLGLTATPWEQAAEQTVAWWREQEPQLTSARA